MSSYDESILDCLSSEASERLHSLHEVGDQPLSQHCKRRKSCVDLSTQPNRLALHLAVQ